MDEVKKKEVLYISYDGMTDPLGQSQVLPYITGLAQKGFQFTLISFEKKERFENERNIIEDICSQYQIDWHPLPYTKKPPVLSTIKDLKNLKRTAEKLHKLKNFEIVHCRSYIPALAGVWMQKKWSIKFIFDMRGFWADERVDGGLWNLKNPVFNLIYNYFKKQEKKFLSKADYVISLTYNAQKNIHERKEILNQPIPIQVIPCCVDLHLFDPANIDREKQDELKNKLSIPAGNKVISYIGSIGTWYMLPEMLAFFKRYLRKYPGSIFLFVTKDTPQKILNEAKALGIEAASIRIRSAARKEVPLYISICDFSLFFIKPAFSKKASSPTKQGEIMAMGKPVICNSDVGDTDYVVKKYASGIVINQFSNAAYDSAIDKITQQSFNPTTIRKGAIEFYSLEEGLNRYSKVYKSVLGEA
ncbi:MAG: glycosyltransferase [Chitinophagaceae bacterium]